ncbi:MAG: hydrogen gas-evolving membrane-bound hydrogenase subunit E [Candidatus Onthomonas sp.]
MSRSDRSSWRRFCAWVDGEEWCAAPAEPHLASRFSREPEQELSAFELYQRRRRMSQLVGALFCITLAVVLTLVVVNLPPFGDPANPTNNEVSRRYIEQGIEETGAVNLVAGMILSYRVFDTFGESNVLFLAATCVTILLRRDDKNTTTRDLRELSREERADKRDRDVVLRTSVLLLMPVCIMVGFYVMLFGHLSPGGGFSGGSILGGGLILYSRTFGSQSVQKFFNQHISDVVRVVCLMGYGLILIYYVFTGTNGLDNHIWLGIPGHIISSGIIMPINVMVGFVVTCTIYSFYALFSKGEV